MTDEDLDRLIVATDAALKKAVEAIDKLTKIETEPHKSMVYPTLKIKERLLDDLWELSKLKSKS